MGRHWLKMVIPVIVVMLSVFLGKPAYAERKHFEGIDIVFFCGGPEGCPFGTVVCNGAKAAEEDLGPNVEYVYSSWQPDLMIEQLRLAIMKTPDAISMMGHPGEKALKPLIDQAFRKGIVVTLANVDQPAIREKYKDKGFGYAGQHIYNSGFMLGKGSAEKLNLNRGDTALVIGLGPASSEARRIRAKGCVDGLREGGMKVYREDMPEELNAESSGDVGPVFIGAMLKKYPNAKLIITDHGGVTAAMPAILKTLGKKPGEILVAGFDLSPSIIEGIRKGYLHLVHDQQPYLQGYLSVLQACLAVKYGFAGLYMDTGVGLIGKDNVEGVADWALKKIR